MREYGNNIIVEGDYLMILYKYATLIEVTAVL